MSSEHNVLLDKANEEAASVHIGGVIFVAVLMVIGVLGNLHVLFVYLFRTKSSNRRTFILVLVVIDMVTCTTGMPFIIFDLRNPLRFREAYVCKVFRFNNYLICTSSMFLLNVIAIDR